MKILFLYTELAEYTLACLRALKAASKGSEIMVIHYPVNPEAPFNFDFSGVGYFTQIGAYASYNQLKKEVLNFNPDLVVVSGWSNKTYLRLCFSFKKRAKIVLTMDNHWTGSSKQWLVRLFSGVTFGRLFDKIWVPGEPQVAYAQKLGFDPNNIRRGFYCCDTEYYLNIGEKTLERKRAKFPRVLLCVARYVSAKNYELLWTAFEEWYQESGQKWELWCAGTGEDFNKRKQHPAIRHLGFVRQDQWSDIIDQTGVFILPSKFEPWGVVVHEFASSGYPLILSSEVGASSLFLTDQNGWSFDPRQKDELKAIFCQLSVISDEEFYKMGKESMFNGAKHTPRKWAQDLLAM